MAEPIIREWKKQEGCDAHCVAGDHNLYAWIIPCASGRGFNTTVTYGKSVGFIGECPNAGTNILFMESRTSFVSACDIAAMMLRNAELVAEERRKAFLAEVAACDSVDPESLRQILKILNG